MKNTNIRLGSWLKPIHDALVSGQPVPNPVRELRGRAKSYAGRYAARFTRLVDMLDSRGVTITREPGPKGGEWSAVYQRVN